MSLHMIVEANNGWICYHDFKLFAGEHVILNTLECCSCFRDVWPGEKIYDTIGRDDKPEYVCEQCGLDMWLDLIGREPRKAIIENDNKTRYYRFIER